MEMKNTEETHKLTESVYRGLSENFYPGIRHVVSCGKAYHKALIGVTSAAKNYTEALLKFGFTSRSTCKGGTEDVGEAIYQIAEAHREIQARIEENTKALFSELILPLEQKLENEFRRYAGQHKKYTHGHKALISPYMKSHDALKKFRKKTKNKMVYDEHKEAQYLKILHKCQERLDDYRYQGLKLALLEERKCHCFVLDRLSSMANMYALHHKQASDILNNKIGHWKQLSTKPHILPSSADKLITPQPQREEMYEHMNGVGMYRENGYLRDDTRSLGSPYRRPASVPGVYRHPEGDFYSPEMYSRTLPSSRGISVPPPTPPGVLQVRGVYSHVGEGESKLSFAEGDVINLIGEKSDGWHYGQNTRSGKYGWFPLSFTEPILIGGPPREPAPSLQSRAKSLGELDNQSLSENSGYNFEHDIPGNIRRPKSMYDGSNLRLVNSTSQNQASIAAAAAAIGLNGTPKRQQASAPPPPPPNLKASGTKPSKPSASPKHTNKRAGNSHPKADYGTDEEDSDYKRNPKFSGVNLRKTTSNDRSAPKIN